MYNYGKSFWGLLFKRKKKWGSEKTVFLYGFSSLITVMYFTIFFKLNGYDGKVSLQILSVLLVLVMAYSVMLLYRVSALKKKNEILEASTSSERSSLQVLEKQQEMLGIFMEAPVSVVITRGAELKLDFINKAARVQMGKLDEDLEGSTTSEHFAEFKSSFNEDIVRKVYRTGKPFKRDGYHVQYDKNGNGEATDAWFDIVLQPVRDIDGNIDGVASYTFDVSDLTRANQELSISESRFRLIADAIPHKIWVSAPDGKVSYFNKGWYEYTDLIDKDELGYSAWEIIHPDDLENSKSLWETAVKKGKDIEIEHRLKRFDGQYFWHLTRVCVHYEKQGEVKLFVGTSTQIQAQKDTLEIIKQSESHFKALANNNLLLIWQVNEQGVGTYVNDTWKLYTGIVELPIQTSTWLGNVHPQDRDSISKLFDEAFLSRRTFHAKYRFLDSRSGQYRWMLDNAQPVFDPEFSGFIGSMTDIHEQELAQISVRVLMEKKDEFFGIASHELKTPITSVKGCIQLLQRILEKKSDDDKALSLVQKANTQVSKLTTIVDDLLDISRIQAGKMGLNKVYYDIIDSIRECIAETMLHEPGCEISFDDHAPVFICADRIRIEQVMMNLLSNAVKYNPFKEKIIINVILDKGCVKIAILDRGIGIPMEEQSFVFDRFFRVDKSSQYYSGLGLGLFISSEIVRQHQGDIGLESEEGKGSTFWFTLPV